MRQVWWLFLGLMITACGGTQRPDGGKGALLEGESAPALASMDQHGQQVLTRGPGVPPTLIYFYPKDGTPGCTREACAFRDVWDRYQAAGLRVIGVSADTDEAHRKFTEEHGLKFSLVADPKHEWSRAFGVGTFAGLDDRVSFLVDGRGRIIRVYDNVDPGLHATEVLDDARRLGVVQ